MDLPSLLPHVNASLNATAMILLGYARVMIAQRQIDRHRRAMIAALAVSGLFLVTYITITTSRRFSFSVDTAGFARSTTHCGSVTWYWRRWPYP